jgi:hypothetical protein
MASGEGLGMMPIPSTCAKAEPQPKRTAVIATVNKHVIAGFSSSLLWSLWCAVRQTTSPTKSNYPRGRDLAWIATICPLLRRSGHAGDGFQSVQRAISKDFSKFESYMPSETVPSLRIMSQTERNVAAFP